ncbi:MAG: hypothetical protein WC998_03725, partial [Candidatus Paceibacterota bacterium]
MADKTYKVGSNVYDIPEAEAQTFLSDFPDAVEVESYIVDKDTFDIPINERDLFLKDFPTAKPIKKKEVSEVGGVSANAFAQVSSAEQPPLEPPKEEKHRPILDALRSLKSGSLNALGGITGASSYLNRTLTGFVVRPIVRAMGGTDEDANMALDNIAMSNLSSQGVVRGAEMQQSLIKKAAKVDENIRAIEGTIWENIQKGEWGNAGELVMRGVMGSIPYLAMTAATAGGGSLATLGTIGAVSASQRYGELEGTPEPKRQLNSALYGGFEAFGELVTAGLLRGVGKVFKEGAVKTIDGNFIKGASKELAKSFGLEGSSEAWTQIGQNLTDILTGVDENKNVLSGVLDAFLIGGISGGGIGTAHAIAALTGRTMASDKEVSDVQENFKQQEVLINQLEQTDVDPVKEALKRNIKFLKVQSDLIMDENYELAGKLTPEQQNQVAELYSVWNQLQDKIDSGQMTDVEAKAMQKTVEGIKGEIKAIKDDLIKRLDEEKQAEKQTKVDEVKEGQKTELDKLKEEETKKLDKVKDVAEGETVNKKKLDEIKETFDTKAEEVKTKTEEEVAKIEEEYTEKEPTMEEAIGQETGQVKKEIGPAIDLKKQYDTDPLYGLKQLAKKFDDFEDFSKAYSLGAQHGVYWHITDNPNFNVSDQIAPRDMSSMAAGNGANKGAVMVTSDLPMWDEYYNAKRDADGDVIEGERQNKRPYAVQLDLSDIDPKRIRQTSRGFGNEIFIWPEDAKKVKVVKVIPIEEALKQDEAYDKMKPSSEAKLKKLWKESRKSTRQVTPAKVEEAPTEVKEEAPQELSPTKQVEEEPVKDNNIFNKQQVIESLLLEVPEEMKETMKKEFADLGRDEFNRMAEQAGYNSFGSYWTRSPIVKGQEEVVQKPQEFTELEQKPPEPISKPVEPLSTTEGVTAPPKVEEPPKVKEEGEDEKYRKTQINALIQDGSLQQQEIAKIVDANKEKYTVLHQADAVEQAKAFIDSQGVRNATNESIEP